MRPMVGEDTGASGAIQAVALLEAMSRSALPGIWGLDHFEDGFPLSLAGAQNREGDLNNGLILSFGFDGNLCALVISREGA